MGQTKVKVKINDAGMQKLEKVAEEMLLDLSKRTVNYAKSICPVDSGKLRASIDIQDNSGKEISVGTSNTGYAGYVEMGTSSRSAKPFMRPALDAVVSEGI